MLRVFGYFAYLITVLICFSHYATSHSLHPSNRQTRAHISPRPILPPPHSGLLALPSSQGSLTSAPLQRVNITLPDGTGVVSGVSHPEFSLDAFLGIPFAQAPTGDLRFNKPQSPSRDSSRAIDASAYGLACVQETVRYLAIKYFQSEH